MWFMRTVALLRSTMRDSEVVAAIVAGDPEGLAEAYDRYASPLYTYCRSLLREPADAASPPPSSPPPDAATMSGPAGRLLD